MYWSVEIIWKPDYKNEYIIFSGARQEAARLWSDLVERHHRVRRLHWKWPTKSRWEKWAKGRYLKLHSQSVQQIIADFCEAVYSASKLRKNGHLNAKYPWRKPKYYNVIYTNQGAKFRGQYLLLPNGKLGILKIKIPEIPIPGRLMEVRLCFGKVILICEIPDIKQPQGAEIGVDLGINTLISATDGTKSISVAGRESKAIVQYRNKRLAAISSKQSSREKHSRRWKRLQHRKIKLLNKTHNKIKDITHKATRKIANFFPGAKAYVGEPFNAAKKIGRIQAQQVSSACNRKIIEQLDYKLSGAIQINEAWSSQTCPVCGCRQKCRRIYQCKQCGFKAPRDVVGSLNILCIGKKGKLIPDKSLVCPEVKWVHPIKYPGPNPGSSSGSLASSSVETENPRSQCGRSYSSF
jgi:putative transposase